MPGNGPIATSEARVSRSIFKTRVVAPSLSFSLWPDGKRHYGVPLVYITFYRYFPLLLLFVCLLLFFVCRFRLLVSVSVLRCVRGHVSSLSRFPFGDGNEVDVHGRTLMSLLMASVLERLRTTMNAERLSPNVRRTPMEKSLAMMIHSVSGNVVTPTESILLRGSNKHWGI